MTDPTELVGRLENGSDRFLKWAYKKVYSGAPVISIPRHPDNIDVLLTEAAACIREMVERREGLEEDLYQAVRVAYRRGALEWTQLNYPQWINAISAGREVCPPAPGAED